MWVKQLQLPTIAVVCATYNGEGKLLGLIASLEENLKNSPVDPEIIFVIDGSADKSIDYLQAFAKLHSSKKIKVIQNPVNLGISESRNIGISASDSEIISFLDDDCRPSPDWLASLAKHWQEVPNETVGVGGYVIPSEINSFNQEFCAVVAPLRPMPLNAKPLNIYERIKRYYAEPDESIADAEYLVGANMSFRKSALIEVGLFSTEIRFGGDDLDICALLRNRYGNTCLTIATTLEMKHEFSRSFKDSLRRSYRYGLGSGKNYLGRNGAFSINPGPGLILAFLIFFFIATSIASNSLRQVLVYSFSFLMLEILFYSLLVTQIKVKFSTSLQKRIKFGFAFLMCEMANTLGFVSALRYVFRIRSR